MCKERSQIVAAPHMAQFVREDCIHLCRREPFRYSLRQQQNWPNEAHDSRLRQARRCANFNGKREIGRDARSDHAPDASPPTQPDQCKYNDAASPPAGRKRID
jgi:hypothetical protein